MSTLIWGLSQAGAEADCVRSTGPGHPAIVAGHVRWQQIAYALNCGTNSTGNLKWMGGTEN